jgi:hypothetical protein
MYLLGLVHILVEVKAAVVGRRWAPSWVGRKVAQAIVQVLVRVAPAIQWEGKMVTKVVAVVYEGDRSRHHPMIFFLLSPFQSSLLWSIPPRDTPLAKTFITSQL